MIASSSVSSSVRPIADILQRHDRDTERVDRDPLTALRSCDGVGDVGQGGRDARTERLTTTSIWHGVTLTQCR